MNTIHIAPGQSVPLAEGALDERALAPEGFRFGLHVSRPARGCSYRVLVRESDGALCAIELRPGEFLEESELEDALNEACDR